LTGVAGTLGTLFLLYALRQGGKASLVVPITALYPLVTIILAVLLLRERVTIQQGIGMALAVIAVVLLSL
jgi:transporter family protein